MPSDLNGLAVVDKAAGWTSHDVVAKARGLLGTRRVGHSGTLDPDATGVLVLGVGRATRLLTYLSGLDKRYVGEVVLGTSTSTPSRASSWSRRPSIFLADTMGGTCSMGPVSAAAAPRTSARPTAVMSKVPVTSPDASSVDVDVPSTTSPT